MANVESSKRADEPVRDKVFGSLFSRLHVFTILFEDPEVEDRFFEVDHRSRILSVAAAGCGIAGHLSKHPELIDAVDTNRHHLCLTALKVKAAQTLRSYEDFYSLFGEGKHPRAREIVQELSSDLPEWIRKYWKRQYRIFRSGLYDRGLLSASMKLMRVGLEKEQSWIRAQFRLPTDQRRQSFVNMYRHMLSKPWMAALVQSPAILLAQGINFRQRDKNFASSGTRDMKDVVLQFVDRAASTDMEKNWILWHCLFGRFNHEDQQAIPPYLRRENHARSLRAPTETKYHCRSFVDVLRSSPAENWSHYSFSDAMDWLSEPLQRMVLKEVLRTGRPGAMLVNRTVETQCLIRKLGLEQHFEWIESASREATEMERSKLYHRVDFYRVRP